MEGVNNNNFFSLSRFLLFLSLLIFLFFNITLVKAQTNSGTLTGKVIDNEGDILPGANIFLEETAIGTTADIDGNYRIIGIPLGKYDLVVSYIGYEKQVIPIEIVSNETVVRNITLKVSAFMLEEGIIVTGQLQGQNAAINRQINSDQIVNVVSEQKIKELPDANAAEAVGRLPGVAVQREGGEASKIMIRGLDPKFAKISVNGIQIPSTSAETRDVDLSLISQSTLSGIELYKALTPDQDADAVAGVVNLVIGKAKPDEKITFDIFGIYSGLTESAKQYRIAGQYSNRFFDNFLGVQAGLNAEKRDRSREMHIDDWEIPADRDYRINSLTVQFDDETRERYGGNLNLDINTGDGGNIKLINLYSYTSRDRFSSDRNYTLGGSVAYHAQATDIDISTLSNSLIGENHLGDLKINWAVAHAYTERKTPFDHTMNFTENKSTSSGMMNIDDRDVYKMPGKNLMQYAYNAFDKATLGTAYFHTESNDERNFDAKVDFEYPVTLFDNLAGIIKAGYKFRDKTRHREYNEKESIYYLRGVYDYCFDSNDNVVEKDWSSSLWGGSPSLLLTDFLTGTPPYETRTIDNDYLLNPVIDEERVRSWYDFNRNGTNSNGNSNEYYDLLASVRNIYTVGESVHGTYAMCKINAGQLATLIAGVRYEYESNDYSAKFAPRIVGEFESQSGNVTDTTSHYKKEYWLPNVHLKISPLEWLDFRVAVSKSISRPDYSMRLPSLYINNQDQEITSGNPNLESAVAWNYDANISFYATQYGLLTISGFRKNIDNVFYWLNDIKLISSDQAYETGLPVEEYGPFNQYELDMPVNTDETKVWGYEIDLQTHFGFLPGVLKNIVVSANYSRIWSKTLYPRFELIQPEGFPPPPPIPNYYQTERELNGQTDYTANITVGYDYSGFSFRISAYFQGPYLAEISNNEDDDIYQKEFSRWDLAFKQVFTDNISAFLNINNLTNTVEGQYNSFRKLDRGGYLYGTTVDLGLQFIL
ncbi:MAG: TonB-dependent receptor [Ignavibacteria bacterium]|jgi:TonB-dependent receptor